MATLRDQILDKDQFGESFKMSINGHTKHVKTWIGICCTIILYTTITTTIFILALKMMDRKEVSIETTIKDSFYSSTDVFSYDKGLSVAVALTAFNSEANQILDPTYGELVFK